MYKVEKKKCSKKGVASLGWFLGAGFVQRVVTIRYESWVVIDGDGKKIAETKSKANAKLICNSLNEGAKQ